MTSAGIAIGADGTIYVGEKEKSSDKYYLCALTPDGNIKWKFRMVVYGAPIVGPDGTIYVGSSDKSVYAITPQGYRKWKYDTGKSIGNSPLLGADNTLYVSNGSTLYALDAKTGERKWSVYMGPRTNQSAASSPTMAPDGTIYVFGYTDQNSYHLFAIATSSPGLAKAPWPKFQHDIKNTGQYTDSNGTLPW